MILHTHDVVQHEGEEPTPVYFLHLNREETQAVIAGLTQAMAENPESESFSMNLGAANSVEIPVEKVEESDPVANGAVTKNGQIVVPPGGGLIVP